MAIRYRHFRDPAVATGAPPREGEAADVAELEALARLGSLAPADEVSIDGTTFQRAEKIAELNDVFRERRKAGRGEGSNLLLWAGAAVLGVVALGAVLRIAALAVKLAVVGGAVAGIVWLTRKALKP